MKRILAFKNKFIMPLWTFKNVWTYYLDLFGLLKTKKPFLYFLYNGVSLYAEANRGDCHIITEIWATHDYTQGKCILRPWDTVVDIGAHKGYFSVYASRHTKNGQVFSFEPNPVNYKLLQKNIRKNMCTNVQTFALGIAGSSGTKTFFISDENDGGNSILRDWFVRRSKLRTFRTKTMTIENIFRKCNIRQIHFLKVDCEGSEYEIFRGIAQSTLKKIDKISMEYHQVNNFHVEQIITKLKSTHEIRLKGAKQDTIGMLFAWRKSI